MLFYVQVAAFQRLLFSINRTKIVRKEYYHVVQIIFLFIFFINSYHTLKPT